MKNSKEQNNEKIEKLTTIAKSIIMYYIKQNYSGKENFDQEMERINKIFDRLDVSFENAEKDSPVKGKNLGNDKIEIMFIDKDNISKEEFENAVVNLIHEIYHSISKNDVEKVDRHSTYAPILEEGYVTYLTGETVRYVIENPIDVPGIDAEELKALLQKQELEIYPEALEVVRSIQLVMEQSGVDSKYEYIFNGLNELIEVANQISSEFGIIISLQKTKTAFSPMLMIEKKFFQKAFEEIDYSNISPTLIKDNRILQGYLINSGKFSKEQRLYEIVKEFAPEEVAYEEFCVEIESLTDDEIRRKTYEGLREVPNIKIQISEDLDETVDQIFSIIQMYSETSSPINIATYGWIDSYAIMVAYDLYQKGIDEPTEDDILKYVKDVIYETKYQKIMTDQVFQYMDYVRTRSEQGKGLKEIIDEHLVNNTVLLGNMRRIEKSEISYWDKVNQMVDITLSQNDQCQEQFYYFLYMEILKLSRNYLSNNQLYNQNDYEEFISRMQEILGRIETPEVSEKVGYTPEMIFIKSVSDNIEMHSVDFIPKVNNLLKIIKEKSPNLGYATGMLDDLCFNIKLAHEGLRECGDTDLLKEFSNNLLSLYFKDDRKFLNATRTEKILAFNNQSSFRINENIKETLDLIITSPEFYQDTNELKKKLDDSFQMWTYIFNSDKFQNFILQQIPEEIINKMGDWYGWVDNITEAIFGSSRPLLEEFSLEKLSNLPPSVQFLLKYNYAYNEDSLEVTKKLFPNSLEKDIEDDEPTLDRATVIAMAKNPHVQNCQPEANKAFNEVDAIPEEYKEIKGQDIS